MSAKRFSILSLMILPTSDSSDDAEPSDDPETPFMILFVEMMIFTEGDPNRSPSAFSSRHYVYIDHLYTQCIHVFMSNVDCCIG